MKELERIEVPTTRDEDINGGLTVWRDGKCVSLDEGAYVTLFIGHTTNAELVPDGAEDELKEKTVTRACPIRVLKPVTRDMAINAAEMAAYGLKDAMAVASFNAALARKHRNDPDDTEVAEHDSFIQHIKDELTSIGI